MVGKGSAESPGAFGKVKKVESKKSKKCYAMKVLAKDLVDQSNQKEDLLREIWILKDLSHPNIVQLLGTFEDQKKLYMLMELSEQGNLYQLLQLNKAGIEACVAAKVRLAHPVHLRHPPSHRLPAHAALAGDPPRHQAREHPALQDRRQARGLRLEHPALPRVRRAALRHCGVPGARSDRAAAVRREDRHLERRRARLRDAPGQDAFRADDPDEQVPRPARAGASHIRRSESSLE